MLLKCVFFKIFNLLFIGAFPPSPLLITELYFKFVRLPFFVGRDGELEVVGPSALGGKAYDKAAEVSDGVAVNKIMMLSKFV